MEKTNIIDAVLRSLRAGGSPDPAVGQDSPFSGFAPRDWDSCLRELNRFGLSPLFYSKYKTSAEKRDIPAGFMEKLRAAYLANASRNIVAYHELKGILDAFRGEGIPLLVLKGAHIAELVHQDIGARAMSDLDVLIGEADADRAHRAMEGLGYRREELHGELPFEGNEFHYSGAKKHILVEVHWRLFSAFYPFRFDHDAIWRNARHAALSGSPALVLSAEDLLLHIGAHSSVHLFAFGLRDLYDVAQIVHTAGAALDWSRILAQARAWRIVNCAYATLLLASRLLEAEIPGRVLDELRPPDFDDSLFDAAKEAVLSTGNASAAEPHPHPNLVLLFGKKGFGAKAGILAQKFLPSRRTIAALYPVSRRSIRLPYFYLKWMAALFRRNADSARRLLRERGKGAPETGSGAGLAPLMSWLLSR